MTQLVELATRFVSLSAELNDVRSAMKALLLNGGGVDPTPPPDHPRIESEGRGPRPSKRKRPRLTAKTRPQARAKGRDAKAIAAAKAEEAIVDLLQARPGMRTGAIAKAAGTPPTSAQNRLTRLQRAGRIERGEDEGWRATVPPH